MESSLKSLNKNEKKEEVKINKKYNKYTIFQNFR